jgi:phosphoribosyl-AMP cyclohydrolase
MRIVISAAARAGGVARDLGSSDEPHDKQPRPSGGVFLFQGEVFFQGEIAMDFSKLDGLIPAVIQDAESAEVLMVGFMNVEAMEITRRTGFATFFSRTRNRLWTKGETSGNRLQVVAMLTDCDDDTVLVKVKRLGDGNVCHTGERTCFFRALP